MKEENCYCIKQTAAKMMKKQTLIEMNEKKKEFHTETMRECYSWWNVQKILVNIHQNRGFPLINYYRSSLFFWLCLETLFFMLVISVVVFLYRFAWPHSQKCILNGTFNFSVFSSFAEVLSTFQQILFRVNE